MANDVKRFVVDIQGREARECVFSADHDRIVAGLQVQVAQLLAFKRAFEQGYAYEAIKAERDTLRAEVERLRRDEPTCDDAEALLKALTWLGVSVTPSREEACARWLELVRTLISVAARSKMLRQDNEKHAEVERLQAEVAEVAGMTGVQLKADNELLAGMWQAIRVERDTLRAEVERLTDCLQKANEQAEHFEREWYLRGDEVERLRAQPAEHPGAWHIKTAEGKTVAILASEYQVEHMRTRLGAGEYIQPIYKRDANVVVPRRLIGDLIEVARMPNAEHVADAHNAAVRSLRAALEASHDGRTEDGNG